MPKGQKNEPYLDDVQRLGALIGMLNSLLYVTKVINCDISGERLPNKARKHMQGSKKMEEQ